MKKESEIQDRIRFLLTREVDRRVTDARTKLPHKCKNNHRQPLDVRKKIAGEPNENYNRVEIGRHLPVIGLCMLGASDPTQWNGTICEDPIDAQRCQDFDPIDTREGIIKLFDDQIKDLVWVGENLPEVYKLLWALDSVTMPRLPWWKALWFKFIGIRPDAIQLPPSNDVGGA